MVCISTTHASGHLEIVVGPPPPRVGCWECELLLPTPPPSGRRGSGWGAFFKSGHDRFTRGGNLSTLTLGAPALVVDISTKNVLHRPGLVVGAPPPSEVCPRRCCRPQGAFLKSGHLERFTRGGPSTGADTGRAGISGIHVSTTDVWIVDDLWLGRRHSRMVPEV